MLIAMVVISSQLLRLAQSPSPARVSQAERRLVPLVASPVRASGFNRVRWFN
jgi:hypothetical protein